MNMITEPTPLEGVCIFRPRIHADARGRFIEIFRKACYTLAGPPLEFVQDNYSRSNRGVLRGLHYQRRCPQTKLVTVTRGRIWDVVADIRRGSPTFGRWFGIELSEETGAQLLIPAGYAHGFCVLSEEADVVYKCSAYYTPAVERGIRWSDPDLAIAWPVMNPVLSPRDAALPLLREIPLEDLPVYSLEGCPSS